MTPSTASDAFSISSTGWSREDVDDAAVAPVTLGSLGSGNHFLELQVVDRIFEPAVAQRFGLQEGMVPLDEASS